jgi:hypothetical protein
MRQSPRSFQGWNPDFQPPPESCILRAVKVFGTEAPFTGQDGKKPAASKEPPPLLPREFASPPIGHLSPFNGFPA